MIYEIKQRCRNLEFRKIKLESKGKGNGTNSVKKNREVNVRTYGRNGKLKSTFGVFLFIKMYQREVDRKDGEGNRQKSEKKHASLGNKRHQKVLL